MIDSPIPDTESKIVKEPVGVHVHDPPRISVITSIMENCASACYGLFTSYETK